MGPDAILVETIAQQLAGFGALQDRKAPAWDAARRLDIQIVLERQRDGIAQRKIDHA